jgi:hypothetical protein
VSEKNVEHKTTERVMPLRRLILIVALLVLPVPPSIDLLTGEFKPLLWLVTYVVAATMAIVAIGARRWPDRPFLNFGIIAAAAVAITALVTLVAVLT